jgi:hypothetical protein
MVRTADVGLWSRARACARARLCSSLRAGLLHAGLGLLAAAVIGLAGPGVARAEPVQGEASLQAANGYARLVLKFSEDVGTEVTTAGSILLIKFERPADVPVDRWVEAAPDYVSGARGDPDGSALRLSLSRKVRVNTMSAGERVFIDLNAPVRPSVRSGCSAPRTRPSGGRRSASARWCSRPSSASCSRCPTASTSPRC